MLVPHALPEARARPRRTRLDQFRLASSSGERAAVQRETGRGLAPVSAYVMLADPSYLAESLSAYYRHVDRIVLSYDEAGLSWTGTPLPVQQCLAIARSIDVEGKCVEVP